MTRLELGGDTGMVPRTKVIAVPLRTIFVCKVKSVGHLHFGVTYCFFVSVCNAIARFFFGTRRLIMFYRAITATR